MSLPIEVVEALDADRCILFVGRRASLEAVTDQGGDYPGQKKLARLLMGKKAEYADALNTAHRRLGDTGLAKEMEALLGCGSSEPGSFHRLAVRHFSLIFTTAADQLLEKAAEEAGLKVEVFYRGDPIPTPEEGVLRIYKFWGCYSRPETLVVRQEDLERVPLQADLRKPLRKILVRNVLFFVGYRPDEVEFSWAYEELEQGFGGKLPRTHLAVSQGRISDYFWQKWVWKGLLLFTADPSHVMAQIEER